MMYYETSAELWCKFLHSASRNGHLCIALTKK